MKAVISYGIKLSYKPGSSKPSRIFSSMAQMIESARRTDEILARSINCRISTDQILDEIETGSILARIREFIEIEDSTFCQEGSEKNIGNFFDRGKKEFMKALEGSKVDSSNDIGQLSDKIESIAEQENLKRLGFSKPNPVEIASNLKEISDSTNELTPDENIEYRSSDGDTIKLQPKTEVFIEKIKQALAEKTIKSDRTIILKIKKPDYLGDSKWEFRHDKIAVYAKIEDEKWMNDFHAKRVIIGSGDALEVKMETIDQYDDKGNLVISQHTIKKVEKIIYLGGRDE